MGPGLQTEDYYRNDGGKQVKQQSEDKSIVLRKGPPGA